LSSDSTTHSFYSVLFRRPEDCSDENRVQSSSIFRDLNLNQVFESLAASKEEYGLTQYFLMPQSDLESITYRQAVIKDLEQTQLRTHVMVFAQKMKEMRECLAQAEKLPYELQKAGWFLDAVLIYCEAVLSLHDSLSSMQPESLGFKAFRNYLRAYIDRKDFQLLTAEARTIKKELSEVTYLLHLKGKRVVVCKYGGEPDFGVEVEKTFERFRQGEVRSYLTHFRDSVHMNHVEAAILERVALIYPETFGKLLDFVENHRGFLDETIRQFDIEVQFYLAYLEFIERLRGAGLKFCYPHITRDSKEVYANETFDLALADKLVREGSRVVVNDFYLKDKERILVVSGPNSGGKTTFARMFGQLHYLARLGYPVPGGEARLFLYDHLFTHFEREEHIENLRGKLQDELIRFHEILRMATENSILIINEGFASTSLDDAVFLSKEVIKQVSAKGMLCVYVTFLDELSSLNEATVSMVSMVDPNNPTIRTYKIVRRQADGLAYAIAIAAKYGLTYESIRRRVAK
jgi:DNA mismatch repair protein MutS